MGGNKCNFLLYLRFSWSFLTCSTVLDWQKITNMRGFRGVFPQTSYSMQENFIFYSCSWRTLCVTCVLRRSSECVCGSGSFVHRLEPCFRTGRWGRQEGREDSNDFRASNIETTGWICGDRMSWELFVTLSLFHLAWAGDWLVLEERCSPSPVSSHQQLKYCLVLLLYSVFPQSSSAACQCEGIQ